MVGASSQYAARSGGDSLCGRHPARSGHARCHERTEPYVVGREAARATYGHTRPAERQREPHMAHHSSLMSSHSVTGEDPDHGVGVAVIRGVNEEHIAAPLRPVTSPIHTNHTVGK